MILIRRPHSRRTWRTAEFDLTDGGTLYDAIRYDDPEPIRAVIRKTYIPNLDLIPGNLELMEFEHETPRALSQGNAGLFFFRVKEALAQVDGDYDVVVIDCPPQLGFSPFRTSAATGVLVTIHPEMLDVMSMSQFLRMTADLMDVIAESGADMSHDWMRYALTRYEPQDAPQTGSSPFCAPCMAMRCSTRQCSNPRRSPMQV